MLRLNQKTNVMDFLCDGDERKTIKEEEFIDFD